MCACACAHTFVCVCFQACSLSELEGKISAVKAALLKRVTEFGPGYGAECSL